MPDREGDLIREYEDWCKVQGLPLMSADELICEPGITMEQNIWLTSFINRWDDMVDNQRGRERVERIAQRLKPT